MSFASDISSILSGVSGVYGGNMPAHTTAKNAVCIRRTGGFPRSASGTEVEEPTFQVTVRNEVYATGEGVCNTIKDLLHGYVGGKFLVILQQGDVFDLGRDENDLQLWSINFRCYYRR